MRPRWLIFFMFLLSMPTMAGDPPASNPNTAATLAETITVTAELSPVQVKQATAKVTVIDDELLDKRLVNDIRDLVKYEPGVYVENDGSRLGLNGFNIRGIGGNRVLTRIDGVAAAQQFSFGPLASHQFTVDVDALKSVEILRGASSSLYGSDALGGVVSLTTKDPEDYLRSWSQDQGFQVKTGYDSKSAATDIGLTGVFSFGKNQLLVSATRRDHEARKNRGTVATHDASRTRPNDLDGATTQLQTKLVHNFSAQNRLRFTLERFDSQVDSLLYSGQGSTNIFGVVTQVDDFTADDRQQRLRLSLDQNIYFQEKTWFDTLQWRLHTQTNDTEQFTSETRTATLPEGNSRILRTGSMAFEQDSQGAELALAKSFMVGEQDFRLTYGAAAERTEFGQIRDRTDADLDTGNNTGSLLFPTRYFPNSTVDEYSGFAQLEINLFEGRLRVTPGIRYDHYKLSPDTHDTLFLESTGATVAPVGLEDDAVSPKLGVLVALSDNISWAAHYAEGFRTPSYSSVNSGFTNVAGGYQTLPNPELRPEASENLETSLKLHNPNGSLNLTWFENSFSDFIADTQFVGISDTGLALFQSLNLNGVEISGFELAGDVLFNDQWSARFSYAHIDGEDRDTGNPIESIEPDKASLGISWQTRDGKLGSELSLTHVLARSESDVIAEDVFLPDAYSLIDLTLFYQISKQFRVYAGGFNLANETYYPWSDVRNRSADDPILSRYSAPGLNFSVNLRYQW